MNMVLRKVDGRSESRPSRPSRPRELLFEVLRTAVVDGSTKPTPRCIVVDSNKNERKSRSVVKARLWAEVVVTLRRTQSFKTLQYELEGCLGPRA